MGDAPLTVCVVLEPRLTANTSQYCAMLGAYYKYIDRLQNCCAVIHFRPPPVESLRDTAESKILNPEGCNNINRGARNFFYRKEGGTKS